MVVNQRFSCHLFLVKICFDSLLNLVSLYQRIVFLCQALTDFLEYLLLQLYRLRDKFPNTASRLQTTASILAEIVDHGDQVQSAVKQIILDRIQVAAMEITSRTP